MISEMQTGAYRIYYKTLQHTQLDTRIPPQLGHLRQVMPLLGFCEKDAAAFVL